MASKSILRERKQSNEFSHKQKLSRLPLVDTQKYRKDVDMAERLTLSLFCGMWYIGVHHMTTRKIVFCTILSIFSSYVFLCFCIIF